MRFESRDTFIIQSSYAARCRTAAGRRLVCAAVLLLLLPCLLKGQDVPAAVYGPFNGVFLADGPGLTQSLALTGPPEDRATQGGGRIDPNYPEYSHSLLAGRAKWTLAFWFHASGKDTGTVLLAGIGDPSMEDARFIGIRDDRLGLWLGRAEPEGFLESERALDPTGWHLAVAASDGNRVTLYADGEEVATAAIAQGEIAPELMMAPAQIEGLATDHFGGKIAALHVYAAELTADQVKTLAADRPDFDLPTYEEASRRWPVQTRAQAGYSAPQDPSTLPRGRGGMAKPIAKPLRPEDLRCRLAGTNPWTLEGGWRLAAAPNVKASAEEISTAGFADKDWLVATVPGTVLTTMVDRGIYPDPDYGLDNLAIPESLAHQDYWYRVEFKTPAEAHGQRLTLTFEGINYAAEVWLNGKNLGAIKGAFLRGNFDVTHLLSVSGVNALAVRVSPAPHPGIAHEQSIKAGPGENGGMEVLDGPTFSASEGWDWIPGIRDRNTGIWQDVVLRASGSVQIGDLNVITTLPKADRSEADIEIEVPLTSTGSAAVDGELTAAFDDVKVSKRVHLEPGQTIVRLNPSDFAQLKVQHPRLWWPNGYGDPALHSLVVKFTSGTGLSSMQQIDFGMREVSYETSLFDSTGHLRRVEVFPSRTHDEALQLIDESHDGIRQIADRTPNLAPPSRSSLSDAATRSWAMTLAPGAESSPSIRPVDRAWPGTDLVIKVNGVRIAARGGNWGMDDSMKRVSVEHLEPFFRLHRDAHINIIRNWMGQNTEESFYALADKYGLMVWNDFWESTENYNLEAEDPQLFLANARDTILRFRHHPSIVVWCGRNEGVPQPIINRGLAELVRTLDHTRYYTGSSNQINLRNSGPYQLEPLDAYYRINRGFSVELGIPSVPTLESLESFIPAPDRWPISDTWAYHDWHQSGNGSVAPFMARMETDFGAPTGFEDFVRKAQMLDYTGHRAIFEGFAAHLWQPNSGRMIWMTQPAWPSTEWNILSWDYDTQSSFYGTMKACEPIHAQLDLTNGNVDLINLDAARPLKVRVLVVTLNGQTLGDHSYQVLAAADDRTSVTQLDLDRLAQGHTILVELDVSDAAGTPISNNFYWWAQNDETLRELNSLPQASLAASVSEAVARDGEEQITVRVHNSGSVPALLIKLTLEDAATGKRILPAYYSENYFSLLAGEERSIVIRCRTEAARVSIGLRGWNERPTIISQ